MAPQWAAFRGGFRNFDFAGGISNAQQFIKAHAAALLARKQQLSSALWASEYDNSQRMEADTKLVCHGIRLIFYVSQD